MPDLDRASSGPTAWASAVPSSDRFDSALAAVSGTTPSASQRSQFASNVARRLRLAAPVATHQLVGAEVPLADEGREQRRPRAIPPHSGAISGWTMDTVPSVARASPHDSSVCAAGTIVLQTAAVSSSYSV